MPALPRLFIDWLDLTIPIPQERRRDVQQQLDDIADRDIGLQAKPPRGRYQHRYEIELSIPVDSRDRKRRKISFESESSLRRGGNYLKLAYSPHNASEAGRALLTAILREAIGSDFRDLFYAGHANRVDFSFDVRRRERLQDLWVRDIRTRDHKSAFIRGVTQQMETLYLGYGKGLRQLIAYDKGAERGRPRGSSSWLRFEYRYTKGDYPLNQLSQLGNPFDGFLVYQYTKFDPPTTAEQSRAIFDAIRLGWREDQPDSYLAHFVDELDYWDIWTMRGRIWTQRLRCINELLSE